jgi:hypothetical protein
MTSAELATEIQNDPTSRGYAAQIALRSDQGVANLLNEVLATISIKRSDISPDQVLENITVSDFKVLTVAQGAYFQSLMNRTKLRLQTDAGVDTGIKTSLVAMLNNTGGTLTRLGALQTRNGSRAEQLWGEGTMISASDVARALGRV